MSLYAVTMAMLVFFDIEEITAVPLPPQPIIPIRIAEFALVPKAVTGFTSVIVETATTFFRNDLPHFVQVKRLESFFTIDERC